MTEPAYQLYCTVCKHFFDKPVEWTAHLSKIDHQRRARLACRRWNKATRECVLVAFGSCSVAECNLLERLSSGPHDLVTDFVWWKKKPNVGLIQFESKKTVEDILKRTNSEIDVGGNNRVQLKKSVDYLELEWNVLLSLRADAKMEPEPIVKKERDIEQEEIDNANLNKESTASFNDCNERISYIPPAKRKSKSNSYISELRRLVTEPLNDDGVDILKKKKKQKSTMESSDEIPKKKRKNKASDSKENTVKTKKVNKTTVDNPHEDNEHEESNSMGPPPSNDNDQISTPSNELEFPNHIDNQIDLATDENNEIPATNSSQMPVVVNGSDAETIIIDPDETCSSEQKENDPVKTVTPEAELKLTNSDEEIIILSSDSEHEDDILNNSNNQGTAKVADTNTIIHATDSITDNNRMRSWKSKLSESLKEQYTSIFKEILIPSETLDAAVHLTAMLETEFKKTVPWCKVTPFRHWYLGIKNCGNNELLLFVNYRRLREQDQSNGKSSHIQEEKPLIISTFLGSPEKIFPDIRKLPKPIRNMADKPDQSEENYGVGFIHKPSGLKFRIICSIFILHEVQTCLLVKYLCQFDQTVLPLLGLINYWANLNSLSFGNLRVTDPSKPTISPLPASLDWLVLLFLMKRKIIPSVRDILDRRHDKLIVCDKDIGFSNDPKFAQIWSSLSTQPLQVDEQIERLRNTDNNEVYSVNNILVMLEILREFFVYYGRYQSTRTHKREIILNTKDGNVIKKSALMKSEESDGGSKGNTRGKVLLNDEEIKTLREVKCLTDHQASILHPIDLRFSLSFCGRKFSHVLTHAMLITSKKIDTFYRYLKTRKYRENDSINIVELFKVSMDETGKKSGVTVTVDQTILNKKRIQKMKKRKKRKDKQKKKLRKTGNKKKNNQATLSVKSKRCKSRN